jgi:hypothetical protein
MQAGLARQASVSKAAIMRKVGWHVMPRFFSLALLCSIDRGNVMSLQFLAVRSCSCC